MKNFPKLCNGLKYLIWFRKRKFSIVSKCLKMRTFVGFDRFLLPVSPSRGSTTLDRINLNEFLMMRFSPQRIIEFLLLWEEEGRKRIFLLLWEKEGRESMILLLWERRKKEDDSHPESLMIHSIFTWFSFLSYSHFHHQSTFFTSCFILSFLRLLSFSFVFFSLPLVLLSLFYE